MDEGALARLRALTYMDLAPHRALLAAEMLADQALLDQGVAATVSAYLGERVTVADLPADVLDNVRQEVRRAVRRYITDR